LARFVAVRPNLSIRLPVVQFSRLISERALDWRAIKCNSRSKTMRTKFSKSALALIVPGLLVTTVPAGAVTTGHAGVSTEVSTVQADTWGHRDRGRHRGWDRGRGGYERRYDEPVRADTRIWRGDDGQYYCRRENGTTGLLIGAAVGGLIGHEVAGRGDRTLGVILGAAGGAILGRAIDRSNARCR
jgi:hypothetical protein